MIVATELNDLWDEQNKMQVIHIRVLIFDCKAEVNIIIK